MLGSSIGIWTLCNILADTFHEYNLALFFTRISIIWVLLLPIFFVKLITSLYFSDDRIYLKKKEKLKVILYTITLIIILFSLSKLNVVNIKIETWGTEFKPGILYYVLFFHLIIGFGFSLLYLFKICKKSKDNKRYQAKLILIGTSVTLILSVITGIFYPVLGHSYISTFTPSTSLVFLLCIAIAITKHSLFNIKIITTQIVVFLLWLFILLHMLMENDHKQIIIESGTLIISVVFGIIFIRTVLYEIKQQEKIDKLSDDLAKAYVDINNLNQHIEKLK